MKPMIWTAVAMSMAIVGCGRGNPTPAPGSVVTVEGKPAPINPFGAAQQLQEFAQQQADLMKEMESMKPVDPVNFEKLMEFLPMSIEGYTEEDPKGTTIDSGPFKITTVEREYRGDSKHIKITIIDGGFNQSLYMPIAMASKFSQQSTEGYNKGVTIDGDPGSEEFRKSDKNGRLTVIAGKRFLITIEGRPLESDALCATLAKIDRKKLAGLK